MEFNYAREATFGCSSFPPPAWSPIAAATIHRQACRKLADGKRQHLKPRLRAK
jgi:hypothetical protein